MLFIHHDPVGLLDVWGPAALALKDWGVKVLLPPANEIWGKVIFSQACVKNSVYRAGMPGPTGCLLRGVSAPRGCLVLEGVCSGGGWSRGVSGPRRCLVLGGVCSGGMPVGDPPTAAAAGGTHPTGMHSC